MKKYITLLLLLSLFTVNTAVAQNNAENYVRTRTMLTETADSCLDQVTYMDGLGRTVQTVKRGFAPTRGNLVDLQEYDAAGRPVRAWNPILMSGELLSVTEAGETAASIYGDSRAYSENLYETSPLDRVTGQYGPGTVWHTASRAMRTEYLTNTLDGETSCKRYTLDSNGTPVSTSDYPTGTLYVVRNTDEDNHVSYRFTDKQERLILERRMNGTTAHDTYYIYDIYGNLAFVLQPMYQDEASLEKYAFQYRYDKRNRCVWKKLPGADYVTYTYNDKDQLVNSQDGNQRAAGRNSFYKYDTFGRLTEQGEGTKTYLKNYYDDYSFVGTYGFHNERFTEGENGHGRLTGCVYTLFGSELLLYKAFYYDEKGRVVKTVGTNMMGGFDTYTTTYSFTGKPLTVTHVLYNGAINSYLTEVYTYTYDHAERLLKVQHTLNDTTVTLSEYTYDNVGRMVKKRLHGNDRLATDYAYNVRNWTSGISSDSFSQQLHYTDGLGTPCYNGNISSMTWQSGSDTRPRGYKFTYDGLDRMKNVTYGEGTDMSLNVNRYNEFAGNYDKNGNITLGFIRYARIKEDSCGTVNALMLRLDGNQLRAVEDYCPPVAYSGDFEFHNGANLTVEYYYDKNGNLCKDLDRGIDTIQYNCLNLPQVIAFSDGSSISYLYDIEGNKRRVIYQQADGTTRTLYYSGGVIYDNGKQQRLLTEEGYVTLSDNKYHYYLKDHQGNIRVVANQDGTVEEVNHYYPFGGVFTDGQDTSVQPYKYNGKELETANGLNWYDYGARMYDPALGRFTTMDPLAEEYYSVSPYTYCLNNPVKYVDPTGCDTVPANEVWDYDLINFRTNGMGIHEDNYIPVSIDGEVKYHLHLITSGENEGNYIAIEQLGIDGETETPMYEYKFVVGRDKLNDFLSGDTQAAGFQYNFVRFAADNGVDGRKGSFENMLQGYLNIIKDPMNWIPNPFDPTHIIPKSYYTIKPWNRFQMLNRGKYTKKNYGTYRNALKQRSIDYRKWKQR